MKIGTIYTSLDLDIDKVIKALEKEKRREQRKLQQQKDNEPERIKRTAYTAIRREDAQRYGWI